MGLAQFTFNLQAVGTYQKKNVPSCISYHEILCGSVLPMPIPFHFGQNFVEEKRLETQLETATHICEDLKNKNISSPGLGKFLLKN